MIGTAVFAVSGALVAGRKQMDLFGVVVLAVVTAVGGGTLRDLLLGRSVFWIGQTYYLWIAVGSALMTVVLARWHYITRALLPPADALGLAAFSVIGAERALESGVSPYIAIAMGVVTAIVGGMIRDQLSGETPLVLRREIYATASMLGATIHVAAHYAGVFVELSAPLAVAAVLVVRLGALYRDLSLPLFSLKEDASPGDA